MSYLSFKNFFVFTSIMLGLSAVVLGPEFLVKRLKGFYERPELNLYPLPCLLGRCLGPTLRCFLDEKCRKTTDCIITCTEDEEYGKIASCAYICEMTHGYKNPKFSELLACMLANANKGCFTQYPDDGKCIGSDKDALENVQSLEQVKGDWWVVWGLNCGEGDYPGGYDGYPCQHERFIQQSNGQWINNVTYCDGTKDKCSSDFIVTVANISLSRPGVIEHSYTDAPLSPQVEQWRVMSWPDQGDYLLSLWCGELPVLKYSGGLILSRHRNARNIPQKTLDEFKRVTSSFGLTWDMFCQNDNDHCPV